MTPFFDDLLERLHALHADLSMALDDLPAEALDWAPGPDIPSPCALIMHLTGAERFWFGDVAMGDPSQRDRDAEFRAQGLDVRELHKRLEESEAYARMAFAGLGLADLEAERISPRDGAVGTVAWAVLHGLEHTAIHVGHLQMLRQWWQQKQ